jgi:PAS domain S-box-containing protein
MPWRSYIRSMLPVTRRQWAGAAVWLSVAIGFTWSTAVLIKNKRLESLEREYAAIQAENAAIQLRELKYWALISLRLESAVVAVDANTGKITGWNPAATKMLGWTPEEVVGSPFIFLVPQEAIASKYRHTANYLEQVTDPKVFGQYDALTKVIWGSVNTKSGQRIKVRIAVRTVGVHQSHKVYIATIDRERNIEDIEAPPVSPMPEVPQPEPKPDPSVVEKIRKQSFVPMRRRGRA